MFTPQGFLWLWNTYFFFMSYMGEIQSNATSLLSWFVVLWPYVHWLCLFKFSWCILCLLSFEFIIFQDFHALTIFLVYFGAVSSSRLCFTPASLLPPWSKLMKLIHGFSLAHLTATGSPYQSTWHNSNTLCNQVSQSISLIYFNNCGMELIKRRWSRALFFLDCLLLINFTHLINPFPNLPTESDVVNPLTLHLVSPAASLYQVKYYNIHLMTWSMCSWLSMFPNHIKPWLFLKCQHQFKVSM